MPVDTHTLNAHLSICESEIREAADALLDRDLEELVKRLKGAQLHIQEAIDTLVAGAREALEDD
jgi:hypothetical protein